MTRFPQPALFSAYILAATPVSLAAGMAAGGVWLPLAQAVAFYPLFALLLLKGSWKGALAASFAWAACTALLAGAVSYRFPAWAEARILHAQSYQREMFTWVATGAGPEGDIRLFLPEHALHLGLFAALTLISAGFLGLILGAALLNYMSFYVGTLLLHASKPGIVLLLAWPPWAAARVAAFILIAVGLSSLTLRKLGWTGVPSERAAGLLKAGLALIVADVLLKWLLAPFWQSWLHAATDLPR